MTWIDRRSFIVAAIALPISLRLAYAQGMGCLGGLRVAYLVPLTGPYATTGNNIFAGVQAAGTEASNAGCAIEIAAFDTRGSVSQLFEQTHRAVHQSGVNVVVAPFGSAIVEKLAAEFDSVLFVDLIQSSARANQRTADNYVSILYTDFLLKDLSNRDKAHFNQGKASLEIIASAAHFNPRNVSEFIALLGSETIDTPSGRFAFDPDSRALRLR